MTPLTLLAAQKVSNLMTAGDALQLQTSAIGTAMNIDIPALLPNQVLLSSAAMALADSALQLSYPRICIYSSGSRNTKVEKFRSFSGTVGVTVEIWTSSDLLTQADEWIHLYAEGVTSLLRSNTGDWGDGFFYSGSYDLSFQAPKAGGLGYVECAQLTFDLTVSVS